MEQKGLRTGHFLALGGALVAFASLWRPWYTIEIPQQLRDLMSGGGRLGQDPGLLGQMSRGLATTLPSSLSASGWKELEGADVAVTVGTLAVVALVLGAAGESGPPTRAVRVDPAASGRLIAAVGALIGLVAVVHLVRQPGGAGASELVHIGDGLWLALAGAAVVLAGGLWAAADTGSATSYARTSDGATGAPLATAFPPLTPDLPPVFAEAPGAAASSVAPPRA